MTRFAIGSSVIVNLITGYASGTIESVSFDSNWDMWELYIRFDDGDGCWYYEDEISQLDVQ